MSISNFELLSGQSVIVKELNLKISPPKLIDIATIGEVSFNTVLNLFCAEKQTLAKQLDPNLKREVTNLELISLYFTDRRTQDVKQSIELFLMILFPEYTTSIEDGVILLIWGKNIIRIDENNYSLLKEAIGQVCFFDKKLSQQSSKEFNPINAQAAAIAEKIKKGRKKAEENDKTEHKANKSSALTRFSSLLSITLGISINEIMQYTLFQFYDSVQRYHRYLKFDIELRASALGGSSKEKKEDEGSFMDDIYET